jgi:hypothetical protein
MNYIIERETVLNTNSGEISYLNLKTADGDKLLQKLQNKEDIEVRFKIYESIEDKNIDNIFCIYNVKLDWLKKLGIRNRQNPENPTYRYKIYRKSYSIERLN